MSRKLPPNNFLHRLVQLAAAGTVVLGLLILALWAFAPGTFIVRGREFVSMPPGTAALFALLGLALWAWLGSPEARQAHRLVAACGVIVIGASVWVLVTTCLGFAWPRVQWFPTTASTSSGDPSGDMSHVTAGAFVLSTTGLLLRVFAPLGWRIARWVGLATTSAAGLIGFVIVLGCAVGTPPLSSSRIIPMAQTTAVAFILFNAGVLLAGRTAGEFWERLFAPPLVEADRVQRRFAWRLVGLAMVLTTAISGTAFLFLRHQRATVREHVQADLNTVADLKVTQIVNWRNERLSDARFFAKAAFVGRDIYAFLDNPADPAARAEVLHWLDLIKAGFRYEYVGLLNRRLQPLLSVPEGADACCPLTHEQAAFQFGDEQTVVVDLHRGKGDDDVHMSILLRVFPPSGTTAPSPSAAVRPIGIILLRLDPHQFLYPLVQSWPAPSRTAEILLVRREQQDVVFLSQLRHEPAHAMGLRIPLTRTNVPAVRATLGESGLVSGEDYRGVPVVAAIRAIPDSPWFLVAKIDQEEFYAPLRWQAILAALVAGGLLLSAGLGVTMLWRQRTEELLRRELNTERELKIWAERFRHLMDHANDIILLTDQQWRIADVNQRALQTYGYSREELQRLTLPELRTPASRAEFSRHAALLEQQGHAVFESEHQRKDGSAFSVEVSARLVEIGGECCKLAIIRDVTGRKLAEAELRETRDFLASLLDYANAPIIVWDPNFRINCYNRAFERLTGRRAAEVLGRELAFLFPPDHRVWALDHVLRATAGEHLEGAEIPIQHTDGSVRMLLWNSAVVRNPGDQRVLATIAQGQDITERLEAEAALRTSLEEKTTLLKEVHHRVKNNLQVVMSLLNLQAARVTNPEVLATLQDTRQRVRSMALLHETLYRSDNLARVNLAVYVESLCAPLWRAQGRVSQRVRLDLRVADVSVGLEQAVPCGLLINELVSNALKHAFPDERAGRITVEICRGAGDLRLTVADNGVGLSPQFDLRRADTLGLQLVFLLAGQLHGTVECQRNDGTAFHVTMPFSSNNTASPA